MSVTTGRTFLCVTLDLAEIYRVTRESPRDGNVSRETSYACEA